MQIRHLRNSKIITGILILCVAYISMAAGVYIGIAGNDTSKAYYSLIVIIPAIVTYFSRKYIKSYPLFMVINLVFVVIAALLADTDLEFAGYVICAAAISGHSIRLKNLYVNKKQYERVQENIYDETGKSKDDMLIAVNASEKLHIAYGIFMIGFYILGGIEGNSVLMEIQAFLFVMFVLCQFVYNQVSRLYEVFVFNEGKSEFPARRIMGINVLIMIVFGLLLVFGMLIFYHGRYGNIFSMIGMALLAIIKWILKLLLMLRGDDDTVMDDYIEETTTSPEPVEDEMDVMVNNAAGNALMEVVAIFLIIGVIILIIVTIVRYASRFRKSLDNDKDEVEYINNDEEKEYKVKKSVKVKDTKDKANIQYRKLYKKYAKSKKVVTKSKLAGAKVDSHMMPEEITSKLITDDEAKARRITDDYEKARYSNGEVSEEDISFLKNFK